MKSSFMISEEQLKADSSKKMILYFAIISMVMLFAGLSSAFIVSKSRVDWLKDFEMPVAFLASTLVIICASVTIHFAKESIKKNLYNQTTYLLLATLFLGLTFVYLQFQGFKGLITMGYYPTGASSVITTTFLYVIAFTHLLHLAGGIIALLIVIYNHFKQKYSATQLIGIELAAIYWHFLDLLWIGLFLFIYFFK
jgi:cytochrome c oxidase subunit III